MKTSFTTFEIKKIFEIPQGRLREWIDGGFITPSIQKASGHGTKNLFSKIDLYGIRVFMQMIDSGVNRHIAGTFYAHISTHVKQEYFTRTNKYYVLHFDKDDPFDIGFSNHLYDLSQVDFDSFGEWNKVVIVDVMKAASYVDKKISKYYG